MYQALCLVYKRYILSAILKFLPTHILEDSIRYLFKYMFSISEFFWKQEERKIIQTILHSIRSGANNTIAIGETKSNVNGKEAGSFETWSAPSSLQLKKALLSRVDRTCTDLQCKEHKLNVGSYFGLIILTYFIIYTCMLHVYIINLVAVVTCLRQLNLTVNLSFKIPITKYRYSYRYHN